MRPAPVALAGLLAAAGLPAAPSMAYAQTAPDATTAPAVSAPPVSTPVLPAAPTGFFFRIGAAATNFSPDGLTFRQTNVPRDTPRAMASGKDFLQGGVLPGLTLGLGVDSAWFYARVGVDVYQPAAALRPDQDEVRHTTLAWAGAGVRLVLGRVALLAGVRVGALLVGLTHYGADTRHPPDYDAISGLYAADLGVQWRPARWLQLDATVGQDFGSLYATTASVGVSVGWSRIAAPRLPPR